MITALLTADEADALLPKRRGRPPKAKAPEPLNVRRPPRYEPQVGDLHHRLQHWATRLEAATRLKAGAVDSQSKVEDIERERNSIILSVAAEMRTL